MAKIEIYGHSDDCIEVDDKSGSKLGDEGYVGGDDKGYVELSTGDVFQLHYDEPGVWRVAHHVVVNTDGRGRPKDGLKVSIAKCADSDSDSDNYTDRATVEGDIEWIRLWKSWPPSREELWEKVEGILDSEGRRLPAEVLAQLVGVLTKRPAPPIG